MRYIDIHSHQRAQHDAHTLRIESCRPDAPLPEHGYYSLGLHPCLEADHTPQALALLEAQVASAPGLVAIGEAGLDRLSPVPLATQTAYLERQIALSESHGLPLIIHCTRAWSELLALHTAHAPSMPWIVHGYRKGEHLAHQLLEAGLYLSFGRYYHPDSLRLAYEAGRLLLETDDAPVAIDSVYASVALSLSLPIETLCAHLEALWHSLGIEPR